MTEIKQLLSLCTQRAPKNAQRAGVQLVSPAID